MKNTLVVIIATFTAIFAVELVNKSIYKNQDLKITLGDTCVISYDNNSENPFEPTATHTVVITGLTDEYVQWEYINGILGRHHIRYSGKLKNFKEYIITSK